MPTLDFKGQQRIVPGTVIGGSIMSKENREGFDESAIERTEPEADEMVRLEERLEELRAEGVLSGAAGPRKQLPPVAYRPGALKRFQDERG